MTTLKDIRARVKEVEPGATAAKRGDVFQVRTHYRLDEVEAAMREFSDLVELKAQRDIEGSRWEWRHVLVYGKRAEWEE